jgi:protein-S-isoprenylcysteine O-methyltransferase Ste14
VSLLIRNVLFTVIVPGTFGGYLPVLLARGVQPTSGPALPLSLALFALGAACYLWSVWNFARRGHGTPLPIDPPKKLVVEGPFRYTRNPMYLGLFLALLGWTLRYQTLGLVLYSLAVAAVVNLFVIGYEEPHLRRTFGHEYDAYRAHVPRWLPRLSRRREAGPAAPTGG